MTARQIFEATLIELSKLQAPSLKLYEFNYLFNKAINQYVNKVYNVYDINQQTTDDLRVLKSTAFLTPVKVKVGNSYNQPVRNKTNALTQTVTTNGVATVDTVDAPAVSSYLSKSHSSIQSLHGATYEVYLPIDYLHMLNCVCIYYVAKTKDCYDAGSYIEVPALRLTADSWSQIVTDIYNRPSPMRPYYYIHNVNQQQLLPTDPITSDTTYPSGLNYKGTDINGLYKVTTNGTYDSDGKFTAPTDQTENSNFPRTFKLDLDNNNTPETEVSLVEKPIALRAGNVSNVRCEIRYGKNLNNNLIENIQDLPAIIVI